MKKYTIKIGDIIDLFDITGIVRVELYKDGTCDIFQEISHGYPDELVGVQRLRVDDWIEFYDNVEAYKDWLNSCYNSACEELGYTIEFID